MDFFTTDSLVWVVFKTIWLIPITWIWLILIRSGLLYFFVDGSFSQNEFLSNWFAQRYCISEYMARSMNLYFNRIWLARNIWISIASGSFNSYEFGPPWLARNHWLLSLLAHSFIMYMAIYGSLTSNEIRFGWLTYIFWIYRLMVHLRSMYFEFFGSFYFYEFTYVWLSRSQCTFKVVDHSLDGELQRLWFALGECISCFLAHSYTVHLNYIGSLAYFVFNTRWLALYIMCLRGLGSLHGHCISFFLARSKVVYY